MTAHPGWRYLRLPQPALHLALADRALAHWASSPANAPFDVFSIAARNAFRHGALAPDMGLFPRADPTLSRYIHRGGATDAGRLMLRAAADDVALAFAWGWISHIVADARIHPLINDGGALLLSREGIESTAPNRLIAHIRVELGIEGWYAARRRIGSTRRLAHVHDRAGIRALAAPLLAVYGDVITDHDLLAQHRNVTLFAALCDRLAALLAADLDAAAEPPQRPDFMRMPLARRLASAGLTRTSPVYAFLNPVRPDAWLVERVDREIGDFVPRMEALVQGGVAALPNYDLNTGRVVPSVLAGERVA